MKNFTKEIFLLLSKGLFISSNDPDRKIHSIFIDIEENYEEYEEYFKQIDLHLSVGDGYYYFSRSESKASIESKLESMCKWVGYLDFLKSYDVVFSSGTRFKLSEIEATVTKDLELKEKLLSLGFGNNSVREIIKKLVDEMINNGFISLINDIDGEYQVLSAFNYLEKIVLNLTISEESEYETSK